MYNKIKKLICCIIFFVLVFCFEGCNNSTSNSNVGSHSSPSHNSTLQTPHSSDLNVGSHSSPSSKNTYTVTWKNYDGSILETDYNVAYGTTPTYNGSTPKKQGDAGYSYTWSGWSPRVTTVTENATYIAQYTSLKNTYTVTWKNYDGSILETDYNVAYGTTPIYNGSTPTRQGDASSSYTWSGWSPNVTTVTRNATYTAQYTSKSVYDIFEVQDGYAIEKYNGSETKLVIPSTINGKKIVEIGEKAFAYNSKLLSVTIPDTVLRIDDFAFYYCTRLYEFKNSKNCLSVGKMCLAKTSLKEITIPESLTTFGAFWTILSPIEKIIIEGNRNETSFIGQYLGSSWIGTVDIDEVLNLLNDHFTEKREDVSFTTVTIPGMGYNKLPTRSEYTYVLKDTNRFFSAMMPVCDEQQMKVQLFANDDKDAYSYGTSLSFKYEYPDWGTWTHEYYSVRKMRGNFYLSLDTIKTIEISSTSNLNTSTLLGRLTGINIKYYEESRSAGGMVDPTPTLSENIFTFETNGGSNVETVTDEKLTSLPTCTKNGYNLLGWFDNENFSGNAITIPYTANGNITLGCKFKKTKFR